MVLLLGIDDRLRVRDVAVERVRGDEVHQRLGVDHAVTELAPAVVGLQQVELDLGVCLGGRTVGVGALGDERVVELLPDLVQRRDAEITPTRDIDRGEVERLAEQALLQGRGDELVGLVADLVRHAERDGARADFRELAGIEEGRGEGVMRNGAGDVEAAVGGLRLDGVDRLAQLRVAEAEGGLRVLEADVGIDIGVVGDELRQVRRHEARVLVDGDVLIFSLDHELGRVEHHVLVPGHVAGRVGVDAVDARCSRSVWRFHPRMTLPRASRMLVRSAT